MKYADYAAEIKRSLTAAQVAEALGLEPNRAGFCKCPFHGEKTASLKLYPGNKGWHCFGCHAGGSVIDLVMAYYGMDMKGAVEFLNEEFQLGLPIGYKPSKEQEKEARKRAAERDEARKKREELQKAQYEAFLRFCDISYELAQMDLDRKEFAPKTLEEEWDERFINALMRSDELKDEADDLAVFIHFREEE